VSDWYDYVIRANEANAAYLDGWSWLIGADYRLLFYNLFGDGFLTDTDGRLLVLDVGFGELVDTECDADDLEDAMLDDEVREEWLRCALVDELRRRGVRTKPDECYGFSRRPPILGGEYAPGNLEPISLEVHQHLLSQLCEQASQHRNGTPIAGIRVEPPDEEEEPQ
jgi:hypothetical protein